MQFLPKGPDIPEELLRLHEEGRVVFFCGSGVSMNAGLPDFKGLVKQIWDEVGNNDRSPEENNYEQTGRYDAALGYLETKFDDVGMPNDAGKMRHGLASVLSRWQKKKDYTLTHRSVLTLAKTRGEHAKLHLVTTNFDRLFEEARKDSHSHSNSYVAPLLPVPKMTNWDGIVYLHGLLPKGHDEAALKDIVVTSGDFGRAYLKERWAARFVTELFREFVVCFIGYSLADPVMRYLADAIDADNAIGEPTNPIFLFVTNKDSVGFVRSKSIKCISYSEEDNHRLLHETLAEWANTYSRGAYGKESIIDANADVDPDKATDEIFIEQMAWALSDRDGVGAKRFAHHNPVPSLHWAKILLSNRWLVPGIDRTEKTSLLRLSSLDKSQDIRQEHIWYWFLRHLAEPEAAWLVLCERKFLHPRFRQLLSQELTDQISSKKINANSNSSATTSKTLTPGMYRLWRLILAGKVACRLDRSNDSYFDLLQRIQNDELDYAILKSLQKFLTPIICLGHTRLPDANRHSSVDEQQDPLSFFDWNLDLASGQGLGKTFLKEFKGAFRGKLAKLFDCIETALVDGLEALQYLDPNGERSFNVIYGIPSIEDHSQNKNRLNDWPVVVYLLRDAWLELADNDKRKARSAFWRWISSEHLVLQRIALFASKRSDVVDPHEWFESLIGNSGALLWGAAEQREVMRLLATTAQNLSANDLASLADTIAEGPPPNLFSLVDKHKAKQISDHEVWLRLKKIECCGVELPTKARQKLESLSEQNPAWGLLPNHREEFPFWMYGTGDPDFEAEKQHILVPESQEEMVNWLIDDIDNPRNTFNADDNWRHVCRENPKSALDGLNRLALVGKWNAQRIDEALQVWREESLIAYGQRFAELLRSSCPDGTFTKIAHSLAFWCEEAAKTKFVSDEWLVQIAERILSMSYQSDMPEKTNTLDSDPVSVAINHPVGIITGILLDRCFGETIHKDEGIPPIYKKFFSSICSTRSLSLRHGRIVLASRIVGLYYADEVWVRKSILPLFDWDQDLFEARAIWCGFLWTGRPLPPLMREIKTDFLKSAEHIKELGDSERQFCAILTLMGLWREPGWCDEDHKAVFARLPTLQLEHCAETLMEYQTRWFDSDAGKMDERLLPERVWTEDVRPFIQAFWPKDSQKLSKQIGDSFAQLVIGTGKEFPDARHELGWILKACNGENARCLYPMKNQTRCLQDFPEESLDFLLVVSKKIKWMSPVLKECLDEIVKARPTLINDERYLKLLAISSQ